MNTPTCHRCHLRPGTESVAVQWWCTPCWDEFRDRIRAKGLGMQIGPTRDDWGPGWYPLQCSACEATWTGRPFEHCPWCHLRRERTRQEQRQLTLAGPDLDPDDERYDHASLAWRTRLEVAVKAELITEREARNAWDFTRERSPNVAA